MVAPPNRYRAPTRHLEVARFPTYDPCVAGAQQRLAWRALCIAVGIACLGPAQSFAAVDTSHCTGATTRAAVLSFISAFNRGDYENLDGQFAQAPDFRWYSSPGPGRRLIKSRDRDHLADYFRSRHLMRDRLGLISFQFNGDSGQYGNFGLELRRSAAGFRNGAWFRLNAKGSLICAEQSTQFIVMTLGKPEPRR
jgi:hypothetical protein